MAAGMNPIELKRGIDLAVEAIIVHIKMISKNGNSNEENAQGGAISAN